MKITLKTIVLLIAAMWLQLATGQTNEEKAREKGIEAVDLIDEAKYKEAIKLLEESQKLDPGNISYPYEIAYAYYLDKKYSNAIKILEKLKSHEDVTDLVYQLLGNSYDYLKKREKAIETYNAGIKKFPNSGRMYLELGTLHLRIKEYNKALAYYEKGIEVDPAFPSNYYRAALLFFNSTEEVWAMIYGELFMNLERNTARTEDISKLLYNTYKSEIQFKGDTSFTVSFSKTATISVDDIDKPGKLKLPFGIGVYEPTLMISMLFVKELNMDVLDTIRQKFVNNYYQRGFDTLYPNALFAYQKKVKDAGFMEAYNHWILMKGDEDSFGKWIDNNKAKWDDFITWFSDNKIEISEENKFYRMQY